MVVNGDSSKWASVASEIQGNVLGSMMFMLYVNDMPYAVPSTLLMFAIDVNVYRKIEDANDRVQLQRDLSELQNLIGFNAKKCVSMPIRCMNEGHKYKIPEESGDLELEIVHAQKDLGALIGDKLHFVQHCQIQVNEENRPLGIIRAS